MEAETGGPSISHGVSDLEDKLSKEEALLEVFRQMAVEASASGVDSHAFTINELASILALSKYKTRQYLEIWMDEGSVLPCRAKKENRWGTVHAVCAYELSPELMTGKKENA